MRRKVIYGYRIVNGSIEKHEPETSVINEIFSLYIKGMSQRHLKVYLKKRKIQAPNGRDEWSIYAIRSVLTNKNYVGNEIYPSIISQEFYDMAQKKRIESCAHVETSERKVISDTFRNFIFDAKLKHAYKHKAIKHMKRTHVITQHIWYCKTEDEQILVVDEEAILEQLKHLLQWLKMNADKLEVGEYVPQKKETLLSKVVKKHKKDCDIEIERFIDLLNQRVQEQLKKAECCSRSYETMKTKQFLNTYDFQDHSYVKELPMIMKSIVINHEGELQLNFKNTYQMKGKVMINAITNTSEYNSNTSNKTY